MQRTDGAINLSLDPQSNKMIAFYNRGDQSFGGKLCIGDIVLLKRLFPAIEGKEGRSLMRERPFLIFL